MSKKIVLLLLVKCHDHSSSPQDPTMVLEVFLTIVVMWRVPLMQRQQWCTCMCVNKLSLEGSILK